MTTCNYLESSGSATPHSSNTDEAPDELVLPSLGLLVEEVEGHDAAHAVGHHQHWSIPILLTISHVETTFHFDLFLYLFIRFFNQSLQLVEVLLVFIGGSSEVIRSAVNVLASHISLMRTTVKCF